MFQDARLYAVGKFQGAAPGGAIHERCAASANGVQKGAQFRSQRLFRGGGNFLEIDRLLRILEVDADAQHILAGEIERDIFVLLEKAHLADSFGGDAAGGEIGHRAGGEFDARLGDVHFIGDHRNADGFQVDDGRIDQRKQNVQVVNHHVVNNVDVQAARSKHAEAVDFEKHGLGNDFAGRRRPRIEALEMADLQNALAALRRGDQTVGFA